MTDLIPRDAALSLPPYDSDGEPSGMFDHKIFVKLSALTIQPADLLSDPRVVALVEALRCYEDQLCEGFCADMPDKSLTSSAMENDCGGCKARAALRAIGGEA